jgi:hypothetical protein
MNCPKQPATRVGFSVKSGWAQAVLLAGSPSAPRVLDSRRIELCDPSNREARQPYHDGFGTARASGPALTRLIASVRRYGAASVAAAIHEYNDRGLLPSRAGIVVGSLIDPETLGNSHVRIHALEGQLFRGIVADAAENSEVPHTIWRERDLFPRATSAFKQSESEVRRALADLGRPIEGPWRAEHKSAALAAWLLLEE